MMGQRELAVLPEELESASAKLVYLALAATGGGTAEELCRCLDLSGLTLYSVLATLEDRGLVERDGEQYYPVTGENSPVMSQEWRQ
ncbi:MAG: helix-turn-helix domain-containing protein [Halobacteriaceae archaeon]